jgi:hypothetical protein
VYADHERAAGAHVRRDARQHVALQRDVEVGEGRVPTQDEVEAAGRSVPPQILEREGDAGAEARPHGEGASLGLEQRLPPALGQILHACRAPRAQRDQLTRRRSPSSSG